MNPATGERKQNGKYEKKDLYSDRKGNKEDELDGRRKATCERKENGKYKKRT